VVTLAAEVAADAVLPDRRVVSRPGRPAVPPAGLAHVGLDSSEEAAYRVALECPVWTVGDLHRRLGGPVAEVDRVLASLVELDLVRVTGDRLRAVDPQVGLTALIARREAEMASCRHELERGRAAAASLAAEFDAGSRAHLDGALDVTHGADAVRARIAALVSQARTGVMSLTLPRSGYLDPLALPRRGDLAGPAAGVRFRTVVADRARLDPLILRHLHGIAGDGVEVRTAPSVPMSALVVDSVTVMVPLAPAASRHRVGAVVLRLPSVVATTVELFERVWAEAIPLDEAAGGGDAPDERELALLELMLAGCTDETAAGKLDVSVRTVRRMVSDLTERLGARGRFQAGALAAERGWISMQMLRDATP
jgi:DNA-binding CsgD family transcriptional regulator